MTAPLHSAVAETTRAVVHTPGPYARVGRCICKYFDPSEVNGLRYATRWTAYVQATEACVKGEAEAVAQLFAAAPELAAAAADVLSHRVEGSTRGDLRDNDASRKALARLAAALASVRTAVAAADRGGRDGL